MALREAGAERLADKAMEKPAVKPNAAGDDHDRQKRMQPPPCVATMRTTTDTSRRNAWK